MSTIVLLAYVSYASWVGVRITSRLSWINTKFHHPLPLPLVAGLGLAPFLLGLASVCSLYFISGYAGRAHLISVFAFLILLHVSTCLFEKKHIDSLYWPRLSYEEVFFLFFLVLWIFFLFFNAIFYGLYQHDSLEYMTVARHLFATNRLSSYPMMNQEPSSGFYGPWTHPPLYVSLLWLGNKIQGHAITPGLSKLFTPWAALLSTLILYSLGRLHSRLTGCLSALVLLSTLLFFLGSTTNLMDSLPVLGWTLVLAFLVGLNHDYQQKWLAIGLAVGLALWTHSQTILLLPMIIIIIVFHFGLTEWRKSLKAIRDVFVIGLCIGIWPYVNNCLIFGRPISDSPAVFTLPQLKWDEFFNYARGLNHSHSVVQYGVFKGWFAIEAFAFVFWFMTLGTLIFIRRRQITTRIRGLLLRGVQSLPHQDTLLIHCIHFIFIYSVGTVVSILLGMNIMIKNERYLLILLPFVSLLAAYGLSVCLAKCKFFLRKIQIGASLYCLIFLGIFINLSAMLFLIGIYYPGKYLPNIDATMVRVPHQTIQERLLKNLPSTGLMYRARKAIPKNALILSLRPSDMYYLNRHMISYLDPALLPFYQEHDLEKAVIILKKLGVTHIHTTNYSLPVQYNSVLADILKNDRLSSLILSYLANNIYELTPSKSSFQPIKDFTPGKMTWYFFKSWNFMGKKNEFTHYSLQNDITKLESPKLLNFAMRWPIHHRHYSHYIFNAHSDDKEFLHFVPGQEYRVDFTFKGDGLITLYLQEYNQNNVPIKYFENFYTIMKMDKFIISNADGLKNFSKRFIARGAKGRIIIEVMGHAQLSIKKAQLLTRRNVSKNMNKNHFDLT